MKKLFFGLLIASQLCSANQIEVDQTGANENESVVIVESVEKNPVLREEDVNNKKRFDALDLFVKHWTATTSYFNALEVLISAAFLTVKLNNTTHIFGYKKYAYLLLGTVASIGITDFACLLTYHSYRFVRDGIEALAPEKTMERVNERLRLYYEQNWSTFKWSGVFGSLCFNLSYGSIEKKLLKSLIKWIL